MMWGSHLKRRGRWWHCYRAVPVEFHDVEPRRLISFSLKTADHGEAKLKAADISLQLDADWAKAKAHGVSLTSQNYAERYGASLAVQQQRGFVPKQLSDLNDHELIDRLRSLLGISAGTVEQKAVLGLVEQPTLSLVDAFERFWDHIRDEWSRLSHDQQRVKRNVFLKSIRNFEAAVGTIHFYEIERTHAFKFRSWWMARIEEKGLKPYTGNREINSLRRLASVNLDIDADNRPNPFARVRLKEMAEVARVPLTTDQIEQIVVPGALPRLHADFARLICLLVNTGMRPVEAIGLGSTPNKFYDLATAYDSVLLNHHLGAEHGAFRYERS